MTFIDLIKRRKNVTYQESEGLNLAVYSINEFKERRFTFKGFKNKYSGINGDQLQKLLEKETGSTLIVYRYKTKVKKYTDRKGVSQMQIRIIGKASMMSRYNPFDMELNIRTEMLRK